ncbi:UDP-galactose transporter senju [Eurytemora carolleeae]|uniref:UDP-galactose transporter senju n=1 Tax=Eurytemora carolleeae TaxID=1294199 RepID=UPI000C77E365|nr:UDP-galactose transporter senju [Eurytemora carolleeae]|eukprot:XP_023329691.1 UDP-galactose transporter senju-like [Eurytemora affinis]
MGWLLSKDDIKGFFPTPSSGVVFLLYMAMFVSQGLLVTSSRKGSTEYSYNVTTVVLLTEILKLILSASVYISQNSIHSMVRVISENFYILFLYLVPSSLYCIYNNLAFYSLSYFNPTSYFMFMQIRLILTGFIYQVLFKRKLSGIQWFSLALLTLGCMFHGAGGGNSALGFGSDKDSISALGAGFFFIFTQVMCSVFAGVYNEYIIKGEGSGVDIMIQNVFMYLDSILCNLILLGAKGEIISALSPDSLGSVLQVLVLALVINNAVLGIITSLFLKKLNSIVKAFASALELVLTALLSVPILGIPLSLETVIAILIISAAVITYVKNPIKEQTAKPVDESKV